MYSDVIFGESSLKPRNKLEEHGDSGLLRYGACIWRLQEMANLTYREARVQMMYVREKPSELAKEFNVSAAAISNLKKRGDDKIKVSKYSLGEIFGRSELYISDNDDTSEKSEIVMTEQEYAICVYQLQYIADLTFREARSVMCEFAGSPSSLSKEFGITEQGVYNLIRRANKKLDDKGMKLRDIISECL